MRRLVTVFPLRLRAGPYWAVGEISDMRLSGGAHFAWQVEAAYHSTPRYSADVRYMASEHTGDSGLLGMQAGCPF